MPATELWLVRHGESVANVAASTAWAEGLETVEIGIRDADVPLTDAGEAQARALGDWLAVAAEGGGPLAAWSSPYTRARHTLELALDEAGLVVATRFDERLRDRELGVVDRLTRLGRERRHPEEEVRRAHIGRYYYRPPGGESWADVALRLRSVLRDLFEGVPDDANGRILIVAHDAVIMLVIHVLTGTTEEEVLAFSRENTVQNASVTILRRGVADALWSLDLFSHTEHLRAPGLIPND
jgi:broad specificity phosphatase PhoE